MSPPLVTEDGRIISNIKDKANIIAEHFEKVHRQNEGLGQAAHDTKVNMEVNDFLHSTQELTDFEAVTFSEVKKIIRKLKNKKSHGPDKLPNVILKKLPSNGIESITSIANGMLKFGHFPADWKGAYVVPMPKPNKPANEEGSLRPISLLSNLGKVIERIMYARISSFPESNGIIPDFQFGFRKRHSTVHALWSLHENVAASFNTDKTIIALLLDIEKAFDTVWINGLVYKLFKLRYSRYLIMLINDYLRERTFKVKLENTLSETRSITAGVVQGSVLGPLLYSIYSNHRNTFWRLEDSASRMTKGTTRM